MNNENELNTNLYDENVINCVNKLFKDKPDNYIFIYTPPKVGSTTLVTSLTLSLGPNYNIIHIHDEVMFEVLTGIKNIKIIDIINYLGSIGKNVYVIDVYRPLLERKISEYFEKLTELHFNVSDEEIKNYSLDILVNRFNNIFLHIENGDHYHEKYRLTDIPPFDFVNKYTLQTKNYIKYIKLRLIDSKYWSSILSKILNTEIIIINDYETKNKVIGKLYGEFKKYYKIPLNYYLIIKNCYYLNYYYNNSEKEDYLKNILKSNSEYKGYNNDEYNLYLSITLENQKKILIDKNHYLIDRCKCKLCSNNIELIKKKIKNGENIGKISHIENVKLKQINNFIYKTNLIKKINKNKLNKFRENKINNIMISLLNK